MTKRIKQYEDKDQLLENKTTSLKLAENTLQESKKDFDLVLEESRNPMIKNNISPLKLTAAKNEARKAWKEAEKNKKQLYETVQRIKKSIEEAPVSKTQFVKRCILY